MSTFSANDMIDNILPELVREKMFDFRAVAVETVSPPIHSNLQSGRPAGVGRSSSLRSLSFPLDESA